MFGRFRWTQPVEPGRFFFRWLCFVKVIFWPDWDPIWDDFITMKNLGGGFKYALCSPLFGEIIQFDEHFF